MRPKVNSSRSQHRLRDADCAVRRDCMCTVTLDRGDVSVRIVGERPSSEAWLHDVCPLHRLCEACGVSSPSSAIRLCFRMALLGTLSSTAYGDADVLFCERSIVTSRPRPRQGRRERRPSTATRRTPAASGRRRFACLGNPIDTLLAGWLSRQNPIDRVLKCSKLHRQTRLGGSVHEMNDTTQLS